MKRQPLCKLFPALLVVVTALACGKVHKWVVEVDPDSLEMGSLVNLTHEVGAIVGPCNDFPWAGKTVYYPWQGEDTLRCELRGNGFLRVNGRVAGVDIRKGRVLYPFNRDEILIAVTEGGNLAKLKVFPKLVSLNVSDVLVIEWDDLKALRKLRSLVLYDDLGGLREGISTIASFDDLEILEVALKGFSNGDELLPYLEELPKLKELKLGMVLTDEGLDHIGELRNLERLAFYGDSVTGRDLKSLAELKGLRELDIWFRWGQLNDLDLNNLFSLTDLRVLRVRGHESLSDENLKALKPLTELEILEIRADSITNQGLKHIGGLSGLRVLNLIRSRRFNYDDVSLKYLSPLVNLRKLDLSGSAVTDAGMVYLKDMKGLEDLDLSGLDITDTGLEHLVGLARLKYLGLDGNDKISNRGLAHLRNLTDLVYLNLEDAGITDSGLVFLANLHQLKALDLSFNHDFTGNGLAYLSSLKNLERLEIRFTKVDDDAIQYLTQLTSLKVLVLGGATLISRKGERLLRRALPECEIVY